MFKVNSWYYVKSIQRGGDPKGVLRTLRDTQVFKVLTVDADGYVIEIENYDGKKITGPNHLGRALLHPRESSFFQEFTPSDLRKFDPAAIYKIIDPGIMDCILNHGRGYTSLRNLIRGVGFKPDSDLHFRIERVNLFGAVRFTGYGNGRTWVFRQRNGQELFDYMAMFFRDIAQVAPKESNDIVLDTVIDLALTGADPTQSDFVDKVKARIADDNVAKANQKGVAVSMEDHELLTAIKYLLATREIFTGKRTRLAYMEETYTRDQIRVPSDIVALANQRREEIDKYREEQKRKIEYANAALQEIDEL